jgi:hypothetical protein
MKRELTAQNSCTESAKLTYNLHPLACRREDLVIFLDEEHHGIYYKRVYIATGRDYHLAGGRNR